MDGAIRDLMQAMFEAPDDTRVWRRLKRHLLRGEHYDALVTILTWRSMQEDSNALRAQNLLEAADFWLVAHSDAPAHALELLHQALMQDPQHGAALARLEALCRTHFDADTLRRVLVDTVNDARKRDRPVQSFVHLLERLAYTAAHDLKQIQVATEYYREVIRIAPDHEDAPRQLAHLLIHRALAPQNPEIRGPILTVPQELSLLIAQAQEAQPIRARSVSTELQEAIGEDDERTTGVRGPASALSAFVEERTTRARNPSLPPQQEDDFATDVVENSGTLILKGGTLGKRTGAEELDNADTRIGRLSDDEDKT